MERLTVCRLLACHTAQNHGVDFIILDPPSRIVFASVINKIWAFKYKAGHSLLLVRFLDQRRGWFTVFIKFLWSYWTHGRQQERRGNWKRPKVEVEVLSSALFGCCFNSEAQILTSVLLCSYHQRSSDHHNIPRSSRNCQSPDRSSRRDMEEKDYERARYLWRPLDRDGGRR